MAKLRPRLLRTVRSTRDTQEQKKHSWGYVPHVRQVVAGNMLKHLLVSEEGRSRVKEHIHRSDSS